VIKNENNFKKNKNGLQKIGLSTLYRSVALRAGGRGKGQGIEAMVYRVASLPPTRERFLRG